MLQDKSTKTTKEWNISQIKQFEMQTGQALFMDEQTLAFFSKDFGQIIQSRPAAVCIPQSLEELIAIIQFASHNHLPITVRAKGLSQCGQTLALPGGLSLSMEAFTKVYEVENNSIWAEANASWSDILKVSLAKNMAPPVLPYNCNLSVAEVLSIGGVGAASFKFGTISAHVEALEVVNGLGHQEIVDKKSPLFHACLSGLGLFGVITKAKIQLKPVKSRVKTFFLVYADQKQWFDDLLTIKKHADYLELFCSPSIQGAKLVKDKRVPIAQWLYAMHVSVEYEGRASAPEEVLAKLNPWNFLASHEESIASYMLRHNSRFELMKNLGQWELLHPWYECFVSTDTLREMLPQILSELPLYFANLVHVVPIAKEEAGFLQVPKADSFCSLMILNPGISELFKDSCLQTIAALDAKLLPIGSKRYVSGYLGRREDWASHFGKNYGHWLKMKKLADPRGIFCSFLYNPID